MSEVDPDWPAITDDSGPGQDGTIINKANVWDVIKAAINAQVYSALYPLLKPKDAIEEVADARGTLASLAARLGVSLNPDGTLKTQANLASGADVASILHGGNWLYNDDFLLWHAEAGGDGTVQTVGPTGWTLGGAGGTCRRCGPGLTDTTSLGAGFTVKVTRVATDVYLIQRLMNTTSFAANGAYFKGKKFGFGCWVKSSTPGTARIQFWDGVTSTISDFHPGDGTWQWLSGVHTVANTATQLGLELDVAAASADAYFFGPTAVPGNIAPGSWIPCQKSQHSLIFQKHGAIAAAADQGRFVGGRPFIVTYVHLGLLGAGPGTQPIIVQVSKWDGGFSGMFVTRPQVAVSAGAGGAAPDGAYKHRCFIGGQGTEVNNCLLSYSIDQVGVGTTGSDMSTAIRYTQYNRPQESLLATTDY
jgi:hypothetical protein